MNLDFSRFIYLWKINNKLQGVNYNYNTTTHEISIDQIRSDQIGRIVHTLALQHTALSHVGPFGAHEIPLGALLGPFILEHRAVHPVADQASESTQLCDHVAFLRNQHVFLRLFVLRTDGIVL